ncbi:MAG TPA: nickel pincer cofactor biosynthesis protein LarC [Syntrophobacteraceae bacterium]|nr:nickel pincer cofactor biosynthesis protein LarC [Syntrophobacteraceae bacterium]
MARIAYFDCFSGVSGDMLLGALLDAGLGAEDLRRALGTLGITGYRLEISPERRGALMGTRCQVVVAGDEAPGHRHLGDIKRLLQGSFLDAAVKERSLAVFHDLAEAEAAAHGMSVEQVHFHEVGAVDAIVDVVGTVAGLALLGVEEVHGSPLPLGRGMVRCAHGTIPIPAPATVRLLTGVPVYDPGIQRELVTPTGAALLATLAVGFGPAPAMTLESVGYGVGADPSDDPPNLLRVMIGSGTSMVTSERLLLLESNIDDMNPEFYDYLMERLFALGALDVGLIPVQMKKNRPGVLLRILTEPRNRPALLESIFTETTTLGVRVQELERVALVRETATVATPYGEMRVKRTRLPGGEVRSTPEYEDCKRAAQIHGLPLRSIYEQVSRLAREQ